MGNVLTGRNGHDMLEMGKDVGQFQLRKRPVPARVSNAALIAAHAHIVALFNSCVSMIVPC